VKTKTAKPPKPRARPTSVTAENVVERLKRAGSKKTRDGMARYGMPSDKAFGVPVAVIQRIAKSIGPNHDVALELWGTGWYEARMVASYIDEPALVTPAQMDQWCRDFDNWGICDTVCFVLFDRSPHAWPKVPKWCRQKAEFVKRGGFVLMACLALHDKTAPDDAFEPFFKLIEADATDERNFVKKGVSWALRAVGRRSAQLNATAVTLSRRLAASKDPTARWIGTGAAKELSSAAVTRRLAKAAR
jgi:3-methyladenine DNA glycosylase AlkD